MSETGAPARSRSSPQAVLPAAWWVILTAGLGLSATVIATVRAYNVYDEAWFLRVVQRVVAGEDLYGEVFYSPLPLAVDVAATLAAIVGVHAFVVDAVLAGSATATCLLVAVVARRCGCSRSAAAAAALATMALYPPFDASPYGSLAAMFSVATLAVLVGRDRLTPRTAALAGVLAGLAFASKQNVGALAIGAAALAIVAGGGRTRALGALASGVGTVVAVVLVPVALNGALDDLIRFGFTSKGQYLGVAGVSYWELLDSALFNLRVLRPRDDLFPWLTDTPPVLLPVLAFPALATAMLLRATRRRDLVVVGLFAVAAFAGAYPRMDHIRLAAAAPCLVAAAAAAWACVPPAVRRWADGTVLGVTAAWVAVYVGLSIHAAGGLTVSSLPHLSGTRIPADREAQGARWAADLPTTTRVFIVRQDAAFAYLVSGAENPTRYDYPATSNIGRDEQREIAQGIADGTIPSACTGGPRGFLEPIEVDAIVTRLMRRVRALGFCNLYRGQDGR